MSHPHSPIRTSLSVSFDEANARVFPPRQTVRCAHHPVFRTQLARNLGCLLDVDDDVVAWSCLPAEIPLDDMVWVPDFLVEYADGCRIYLDACDEQGSLLVSEAAACRGLLHRFVDRSSVNAGHRLHNAKDLLRYANCRTPLNDRVRLMAAIDEVSSLTVAECLNLFREVPPMTGIAWLVLHRFISVDLDEAPIGPATVVQRFQR
jgi:hypothetical protein